ncbi:hypothetical protein [Halothiobacillus sp.]|jgi:hypothetical protein|uniref:hypothetical protein n=1 Tax=Halothiobacillus sp. TaxID=1891311 RepID=UPI002A3BE8B4|nr:hypothetical protein [Halothiobacillus sp.]
MSETNSPPRSNPRTSTKIEELMDTAQAKNLARIQAIQERLAQARNLEIHNTEELRAQLNQVSAAIIELGDEVANQTKELIIAAGGINRSLNQMNLTRGQIEAAGQEIESIIALQVNRPTTRLIINIALISSGATALIMAALLIGALIWLQR